jgi:hypothetical protein
LTVQTAYLSEDEPVDPRFASVDCLFFVIGAQKAGTTWLSRYFREHPNVSVPYWKEHNYWNMVEGQPDPGRMLLAQKERRDNENALRKLAAQFKFTLHAKRQRAITLALKAAEAPYPPYSAYADVILENAGDATKAAGELCPQYALLQAETYRKMAALSDNTRFIYLMRDPVARAISGAQHALRKNKELDGITSDRLSEILSNMAEQARRGIFGHNGYHETIMRLEKFVPQEKIAYFFFEELFDQSKVKEICNFIGVPFVPGDIEKKRNIAGKNTVKPRDEDRRALAQALRPVYDFVNTRFGPDLPKKWQESAALC